MQSAFLPTTEEIRNLYRDEITQVQGTEQGGFIDAERLYLRAVLTKGWAVRGKDQVRAGVALAVMGPEVAVHPYVFRQVCRNGLIMAQGLGSLAAERVPSDSPSYACDFVAVDIRRAIRACTSSKTLLAIREQLKKAANTKAKRGAIRLDFLAGFSPTMAARLFDTMTQRFREDGDDSVWGLVNAVTSTAREEREPQTRWRLEELGGAIAALRPLIPRPEPSAAQAELALV